jgi:hypothetical protein
MSQGLGAYDDLTEFAVHFLLARQGEVRLLPHALAKSWPDRPPLELVFTLSVAAGSIQHLLQGEDLSPRAAEAWRMAALLGVDIYMMQTMDLPSARAADLLTYWQAHDRFFLP